MIAIFLFALLSVHYHCLLIVVRAEDDDAVNYSSLLMSNYVGELSNDGNMFEIVALTDIVIRAFDIHCL